MNAVFCDVTPCGSRKNRRFGGTCRLHHQGDRNRRARNNVISIYQPKLAVLVSKNVSSAKILVTRIMEAICSSETSVLTRTAHRHIPEDGIRHSHRPENFKHYNVMYSYMFIPYN
jgi:hypothetical protein